MARGSDNLLTAPIGIVPAGLLDFFFLKSMGENPQALGQQIQPTLDMLRWYGETRAVSFTAQTWNPASPRAVVLAQSSIDILSTTPLQLADGTRLVVPSDQVWIFLEARVQWGFSAAANQSASFGLIVTEQQGNGPSHEPPMTTRGFNTSVAAVARGGTASIRQPFWAFGDSRIQVITDGIEVGAATVAWGLSARILRLQR